MVSLAFSSDGFSADQTGGFLKRWIQWFCPGITGHAFYAVHFTIRKSAHVIEYAILALLYLRAFKLSFNRMRIIHWVLPTLIVLGVACFDEFRQSHLANREGNYGDVLFDLSGAVSATLLVAWIRKERSTPP